MATGDDEGGERLGIFGGTFDPPHVGHLVTAVNVRHDLSLDRVLLVVNNVPWQKAGLRAITPAVDRLAMVTAAVADVEGLEASALEVDAGGPSYTADTLRALLDDDPRRHLFVILGSDAAAGLPTWERWDEVRDLATIVVVERPGAPDAPPLPGWRWERMQVPAIEVSSTDLRTRVLDGRPLDYLVTHEVVDCIEERGLYRERAMTGRRPQERPLDRLLDLELELPERGTGARAARRAAWSETPAGPPALAALDLQTGPDPRSAPADDRDGSAPRRVLRAEPEPVQPDPRPLAAPSWAGPSRRWMAGFAGLLMVAVVAGGALTYLGVETVRDSTAGRTVSNRLEPDEPGFEGFLEPTPTLLVVHEVDGRLDSMALLGLASGEAGGSVLLIPPETIVESSEFEGPASVAYAFGGGVDAVFGEVQRLLEIGIAEQVVVDDDRWGELTAGVAPIAVDSPDEVGDFEAGTVELAGADVGAFLSARDDGESDLGRLFRHQLFWEAWLDQVAASPDPSAVPGEIDSGIGRFVRGLAGGRYEIGTLPVVEEVDEDDNTQFRIDTESARALVSRFIPFPRGAQEGSRTRVRLLDGTGDADHALDVAPLIVPAGAAIVVVGNAEAFDHEQTEIRYHEPSQREAAERLRDALGTGRVVDDARQTDAFDVTIVLGTDI